MRNIGIFVYSKTSTNIGDPVQSIVNANAWAKMLGSVHVIYQTQRLRKLFERCNPQLKNQKRTKKGTVKIWEIERDGLSSVPRLLPKGEQIHVIMNGWWMHGHDWPPPHCIIPIFVSFHMANEKAICTPEGLAYLRLHQPIGCRDPWTTRKLRAKGIDTWFSGCLTLSMDDVIKPGKKRQGIFVVDTKIGERVPSLKEPVHHVKHTMQLKKLADPFEVAFHLMLRYSKASRILTSRLHCMLPSSSMGTTVQFVSTTGVVGDPKKLNGPRYKGLAELTQNAKKRKSVRNALVWHLRKKVSIVVESIQNPVSQKPIPSNVSLYIEPQNIKIVRYYQGQCQLEFPLSANTLQNIDWDHVRRFLHPQHIDLASIENTVPPKLAEKVLERARPMYIRWKSQHTASKPKKPPTPPPSPLKLIHNESKEQLVTTLYVPREPKKNNGPSINYPLVFTCDKNYLGFLPTVLHSIEKSHQRFRGQIVFKVYVILRDLGPSDPSVIKTRKLIFQKLSMFYVIFLQSQHGFNYKNNLPHVTASCLDRLLIPDLIHERRVVYLDLDILCVGNLLPLFKMKIGPMGLSAKKSVQKNVINRWLAKIGNTQLTYTHPTSINAGVLVMDLPLLKKLNFVQKTLHMCQKHGVNDQIAVNFFLEGQGHDLDAKYNVFFDQDHKKVAEPVIIHFAGSVKPWHAAFKNAQYQSKWRSYEL